MTTAIAPKNNTAPMMEFTPFGATEKIKLSIEIVKKFVAVPTRSGATCEDRDAMLFMMLCQAQRLNPFAGDAFLTGYDSKDGPKFSKITAHVALLKRAESCPDYEGMESGVILLMDDGAIVEREGDFNLPGEKVVGGWAKVYRKDRKPYYKRLAVEQRKPNYSTQFWEGAKMAEQIVKCAEADALRTAFPVLLAGLHNEAEAVDVDTVVSQIKATEPARQLEAAGQQLKEPEVAPQVLLEKLILENKFTFSEFAAWAAREGHLPDADSFPSFADLPGDLCKRMMKAQRGLLANLAASKEQAGLASK